MKHADSDTLTRLKPLPDQVRQRVPPLREQKTGTFYLKSAAFLHFHDDPSGLFADLKVQGNWQRYPVNGEAAPADLLQVLDQQLPGGNQ
ncbi:hypothetical protein IQ265_13200 [Nodosilinea sp. LEGE 06152]|uniref:hypothetical protein n=1 Tax=Nodosilinea sp. LEGE 06152 TaxID=2777966 RepID=UPI001882300C|nr:hypothetical protein [Nodosilinea sp. LEGE 06152]MBE9157773.1 hypothetical protein [Nodosilinea sp. LEGE 06152]